MDPSDDVKMPLHQAVIDNMKDVVQAILLRGTDPNQVDENTGRTVAHCAVEVENVEMLRLLKDHGANMSIFDYNFNTPLSEAVQNGKLRVVQWLLDNVPSHKNILEDMVFLSAVYGKVEVMSILLARGANIHSKNELGRNALFHAAENGQHESVSFLLQRGADPGVIDDYNKTLLHAAADSGDTKTINLVLRHCRGVVNARDKSGDTPLHCAALTNREAVALLLEQGADVDLRNEDGHTALDLAKTARKPQIVNLLRQFAFQFSELVGKFENL